MPGRVSHDWSASVTCGTGVAGPVGSRPRGSRGGAPVAPRGDSGGNRRPAASGRRRRVPASSGRSGVPDLHRAADERLVERGDRPVGRERAEPRSRRRHLHEAVFRERAFCQRVEPVVEIADDHRRQMGRLVEEGVVEQVPDLPVPLALGQAQVPVDQVQGTLRRPDDRHLAPRGFRLLRRSEIW